MRFRRRRFRSRGRRRFGARARRRRSFGRRSGRRMLRIGYRM